MSLLFQVRTVAHSCFARTYRTAAQSNRHYGPSPSDIRPVPTVTPDPPLVVRRRPGRPRLPTDEKTKRGKGSYWSEERRQEQRELFANTDHPTVVWAKNNPEQYAEVVKKASLYFANQSWSYLWYLREWKEQESGADL
jgi:hypothetical protein